MGFPCIAVRDLYWTYAGFNHNRYHKITCNDGTLYTNLYRECTDIIYLIPNKIIDINVILYDTNECSTVRIIYDNNINSEALLAMNELGSVLSSYSDNTSRGKTKKVKIHVVGKGMMSDRRVGSYKLSTMPHIFLIKHQRLVVTQRL